MADVSIYKYTNEPRLRAKGLVSWVSPNIKAALLTADYEPDLVNHTEWADVSGDEISDSGTGYTAGGVAITGLEVVNEVKVVELVEYIVTRIKADKITFVSLDTQALDPGLKYCVLYLNQLVDDQGPDETDKPLLVLIDLKNTGAEDTLAIPGVDLDVPWSENGIFEIGACAAVCGGA